MDSKFKVGELVKILNNQDCKVGGIEYITNSGEYVICLSDRDGSLLLKEKDIEKYIKIYVGDVVEIIKIDETCIYQIPKELIGKRGVVIKKSQIGVYYDIWMNDEIWIVTEMQLKKIDASGIIPSVFRKAEKGGK